MNAHDRYGVGLSNDFLMGSAKKGRYNAYQAHVLNANGALPSPQQNEPVQNEMISFDESIIKKKAPTPIFTKHGKIIAAVIILGLAGYVIYTKHKAKKALSNDNQLSTETTNQQANVETTQASDGQQGQAVPDAPAQGESTEQ